MPTGELLALALQVFGVTFFLKCKNGWYPDTIKYWSFKLFSRTSDKDYAKFFRVAEIDPKTFEVGFRIPRVSLRNWIRELWGCPYCVSFWAGLVLYLARENSAVTTLATLLGLAAITYLVIDRLELLADEPDF